VDNFFLSRTKYRQRQQKSAAISVKDVFVMKTAAEYRAMADECCRWAHEAHTAAVRESYMELAEILLKAASDGRSPIGAATLDNKAA
jgi:hypothetical protein